MMVLLLLLLLLVMVMTMISVLGCTVAAAAAIASGYRCVTLERNSVGNHGVAIVATAQINRVGMIVATRGQSTAATANDDIVVVLKTGIVVVVVVDYDASVASGTAVSVLISAASGHDVMLLVRLMGQRLLQDKLVRRFHGDR